MVDTETHIAADVSVAWVAAALLRGRRKIVAITILGIALALALALTKKPRFSSGFSFLPEAGQSSPQSGLSALAGQFGIAVGGLAGGSQPPQFYADLMQTRTLLTPVVRDVVTDVDGRRLPVPEFLGVTGSDSAVVLEESIRTLREGGVISASVASRVTGLVTVRVVTRSPRASHEIATHLVAELNHFNQVTRQTQAGEERRVAEDRLSAATISLRRSEDSLLHFLNANRAFGSASQLQFERGRLDADVSLKREIVRTLSQQYEDARLREARNAPVITMVEAPQLPALRDPMGRVRMMILWTFTWFVLGTTAVLAQAAWRRQRNADPDDPSYADMTAELRKMLRRRPS